MKLLKRVVLVLSLVCISSNVHSADKPRIETLQELRARVERIHALMPEVKKELRRQYPNPHEPQAIELYRFFNGVHAPIVNIFSEASAILRENPWLEQQADLIYQASQQAELVPHTDLTDIVKCFAAESRQLVLYKHQLDSAHPQKCLSCKKSFLTRKPVCSKLREEYQKLSSIMLDLADKVAPIQQRDPHIGEKYQKVIAAVGARQQFEETKTPG